MFLVHSPLVDLRQLTTPLSPPRLWNHPHSAVYTKNTGLSASKWVQKMANSEDDYLESRQISEGQNGEGLYPSAGLPLHRIVLPVSPVQLLGHQGPRSSGTLVLLAEDGATGKNSPVLPGRPPQPGVSALDKQGGGFCCHCITNNLFISLAHALWRQ